jgi:hypothetical protein
MAELSIPELYQARRDAAARVGKLEAELDWRWLEAQAYWAEHRLVAVVAVGTE